MWYIIRKQGQFIEKLEGFTSLRDALVKVPEYKAAYGPNWVIDVQRGSK